MKFLPRNVLGCKLFFNNNTWPIWYPKQASHTLRVIRRWTEFITFSSPYCSPMPCAPWCNPVCIAQCLAQNLPWSDFLVRRADPSWLNTSSEPSWSQVLPSSGFQSSGPQQDTDCAHRGTVKSWASPYWPTILKDVTTEYKTLMITCQLVTKMGILCFGLGLCPAIDKTSILYPDISSKAVLLDYTPCIQEYPYFDCIDHPWSVPPCPGLVL